MPTKWTAVTFLLAGGLFRHVWAWCLAFVLLCGLIAGQSASSFAAVDHHVPTSVVASGAPAESTDVALSCHPALACAAFVIASTAVAAFISDHAKMSRPDLAPTQLRFGGPSVSLPPPRLVI